MGHAPATSGAVLLSSFCLFEIFWVKKRREKKKSIKEKIVALVDIGDGMRNSMVLIWSSGGEYGSKYTSFGCVFIIVAPSRAGADIIFSKDEHSYN